MSLFDEGGRRPWKYHLVTFKNVTTVLERIGVKVNLDNVTKYDGFFF